MQSTLKAALKRGVIRMLYAASNVPFIYPVCKKIVDLHNNENNGDFAVNGEWRFLRERLRDARVVFDVGANVGSWTRLALEVNPELRIYCFEPCSATFDALTSRSIGDRVVFNNIGLGDAPGTGILHVTGEGEEGGCNSLYFRKDIGGADRHYIETVRIETFDGYCAHMGIPAVDFVKIDTEGYELQVLKGMHGALRESRIGAIQFEYGGTYIDARIWLRDIWEYVESLESGYDIYKLFPDGARKITRYAPSLENFQYANYAIFKGK